MNEGGKHMANVTNPTNVGHEIHEIKSEKKESSNVLVIAVICIALIIGVVFGYWMGTSMYSKTTTDMSKIVPKVESYLTTNFLSSLNATAKITNYTEMAHLINLTVAIMDNNGTKLQEGEVDITKDGEFMVSIMYNLSAPYPVAPSADPTTQPAAEKTAEQICAETQKVATPQLDAFVVSYCPYGLQMQRVLSQVIPVLGNSSNIKVRYIGSISNGKIASMHGDTEAVENHKQICIREEQGSKYWTYVDCFMKKGDSATCLTSAGIDQSELNACMNDSNRGIKYAQVDFDLANQYQVSGSPTLIINGQVGSEFTFGGRDPNAVKQLICCGFSTPDSACNQALDTTQAAPSFSETYSANGAVATPSANCG